MKKLKIIIPLVMVMVGVFYLGFVAGYNKAIDVYERYIFENPGYYWIDANGNPAHTEL